MIVDVGDTRALSWVPADGADATLVTAALTAPNGTTSALTVTHVSTGTYAVAAAFPTEGDWRLVWTSTGPAESLVVGVAALLPAETAVWAPDLRKVGSHIPSRTRSLNDPDVVLGTFSSDTEPTDVQVDQIVGSAVATVAGFVGRPVKPAAYPLCQAAAALWSSYWVELSWPGRDADVSVFGRLRDDAILLMNQAKAVNVGAGGGTDDVPDVDGLPDVMPTWCFPPAIPVIL